MSVASPRRVVFLVADLGLGGIQSMVDALARGLDRARFAAAFVCFDSVGVLGEALARDGFQVVHEPRRPGLDRTLPGRLARRFRELGAAVVHAHNRTALFYGVLAKGKVDGLRMLYTEHDRSFPEKLRVRLLHAVLARRVDHTVAVCNAVRDAIVATERFPAARTSVIVNGVAPPARDPSAADARARVEAEFPAARGRVVVLAVGHLTPVKDHATLLEACARLEPGVRPLLIVAGDGPLRAELERKRDALGLANDVLFPGYRRDVDGLLRGCDLLALSSVSEGLSIALVEAIARGVPVVATRVGGNGDVVEDGENGIVVPASDPAALATGIDRLARDPALRSRFGDAGRTRYARAFALEGMIDAYQRLYAALTASAHR
ncbi:MAG: glycosyltransferase [Planctomycetes bacterium]|nr:glycosyltransferase [Planctomycetota bacterium]MCC7172865.1 glycosyltransferase [Planctomycetota bacterium]